MGIGRNDLCLCGSGRKYKKCCGKDAGTIEQRALLEQMSTLQAELFDYAMKHHSPALKEAFQPLLEQYAALRQNEQAFLVTFELWALVTLPVQGDDTVLEKFIKWKTPVLKDKKVAETLQSWRDVRFMGGVIESCSGPNYTVKDTLTDETFHIQTLKSADLAGSFVTGALLPHGEEWTFFMTDFHFESRFADKMNDVLKRLYAKTESADVQTFYRDHFMALINALFETLAAEHAPMEQVSAYTWQHDAHRETAEQMKEAFLAQDGGEALAHTAMLLWNYYCTKADPVVRKPEAFIAAMDALLQAYGVIETKETKASIAARYGVSASTLSKRQKELDSVLKEKLEAAK